METWLHHEVVEGARASATLLVTHGIYGTGGNWRSIARALVERRPTWRALLVDLRQHGRSDPGEPPHTIAACAEDLAGLCRSQAAAGAPVTVACGHSFGGKVVLALRAGGAALAQTWLLDSTPSARPGEWDAPGNPVRDAWNTFAALDRTWTHRDAFVEAAVTRGLARPLAAWMATNLGPSDEGLRLRLDLPALRDLALDYYARDLWPAVLDPALAGEVHVVVATRSTAVSAADRARLAALPPTGRVRTHKLDAGHWLHIEQPGAVVDLLATYLPTP